MKSNRSPALILHGIATAQNGSGTPIRVVLHLAENPRKQKGKRVRGHIEFRDPVDPRSDVAAPVSSQPPEPRTSYLTAGSVVFDRRHARLSVGLSFPGTDLRGYRLAAEAELRWLRLARLLWSGFPTKPADLVDYLLPPVVILLKRLRQYARAIEFRGVISESGTVLYRVKLQVDISATVGDALKTVATWTAIL